MEMTDKTEGLAMMRQEIGYLKAALKFFEKNRRRMIEHMTCLGADEARERQDDEAVILRLDYAAQGVRRMLADANNALREEKASVAGAARYHKTMWEKERRLLQARIGNQRSQINALKMGNAQLKGSAQAMLNGRVALLAEKMQLEEEVRALREALISAHHCLAGEPVCDGCPKYEECLVPPVVEEAENAQEKDEG